MMTQSVMAPAADIINTPKLNGTSAEKKSANKSIFGNLMNHSMKSDNDAKTDKLKKSTVIEKKPSRAKDISSYSSNEKLNLSETSEAKTSSKVETETAKTSETSNDPTSVEEGNEISERILSLMNVVNSMKDMIQKTVQESLDLTTQELEELMETLGFTMFDLLNTDNLKQLVLLANGAEDITSVLTDENLAQTMDAFIEAFGDLQEKQEFQLLQNELKQLMDQDNFKEILLELDTITTKSNNELQELLNSPNAEGNLNVSIESFPVLETNRKEIVFEVHNMTEEAISDETIPEETITIEKVIDDAQDLFQFNDSEKDNSNMNSKNQSEPDINGLYQMNNFVNDLATIGMTNGSNFAEQLASVRQMREITNQILEQIKVTIKPTQTSMELQLNPENLGKINLSVIAKDGVLTAQFTTQNEIAKEAIESQLQILKDNLNNQGLKVESIEVTVSTYSFSQSDETHAGEEQQSNTTRRNKNKLDVKMYDSTSEEDIVTDMMERNGNSVDYTV